MDRRITAGKREREKAKQQKRQEKLKRKEERQTSGTNSFDDMIAYVDENGMLHDTPPERKKEEIDASTIAVSTPKQEDVEPDIFEGVVERFNVSRGYGFIADREGGESYFFHISEAPADIAEGDKVIFEIERGTRGINAVRISINNKQ